MSTATVDVLRRAVSAERTGYVPLLALRPAAGIALGLVIGVSSGHVVAGVLLAAGAIPVGVASLVGRVRTPVLMFATTCVAEGLAAFGGSLTANITWVHVIVMAGFAFAAGLCVVLGAVPAAVATQTAVAYVVFGRFPLPLPSAAQNALLLAGGGVIQLVLVSSARGRGRFRAERSSTASAFRALADLAVAVDNAGVSLPAAEALAEAAATLNRSWAGPGSTGREAFRGLHLEAERLRVDLLSLTSARMRLAGLGRGDLVAYVDAFRRRVSVQLSAVADAVATGGRMPLADLDVPADRDVAGGDTYVAWWFARGRMAAVAGQVRAAARMAVPHNQRHTRGRPAPPQELRAAVGMLRANLDPGSSTFRHATRLAVAVPVAALLSHLIDADRGYWVALTALLVLKPDFATTSSRGVARIGGTAVGVGLASLLAAQLHPRGWDLVLLVSVLAYAALSVLLANYAVFSAFMAATVVFLISVPDPQGTHVALERLIDTGAGGSLAFVAFLLWPAWQGTRLAPLLSNLLGTQAAYVGRALDGLAIPDGVDVAALRRDADRARVARSNVETALQRVDAEPASRRGDPATARAVLSAATRIVRSAHELAALVSPSVVALPALRPFRRDLVTALETLADDPARPIPDLRAAHDRLANALAPTTGEAAEDARRSFVLGDTDQLVDSVDAARDVLRRGH
ncbi:MAG TPA: FUSC family protein [Mycobacteriales bacterium]